MVECVSGISSHAIFKIIFKRGGGGVRLDLGCHNTSQGGHRPRKHGKPGKLREFEKWSKSQGNSGKFEF